MEQDHLDLESADITALDTSSIPTITIDDLDITDLTLSNTVFPSMNTVSLGGTGGSASVYTIGINAPSGGGGGSYAYTNTWNNTWNNGTYTLANTHPAIKIQGNADVDGDLTVQGVSVLDTLNKINERLAILVPDPKRLEKYTALKEAYEHYKTLEALCIEQDDADSKK